MRIIGNDQKNNGQDFWEILERIIGKISSIIGAGLPRTYNFPSRPFGKTKVVHRSFQGKWFDDKYTWLHYDDGTDSAYCFTCKTAHEQNKLSLAMKT